MLKPEEYQTLIDDAEQEESAAREALADAEKKWQCTQTRWHKRIQEARDALVLAEAELEQAKRRQHVDALNDIRKRALKLALVLDEGLDNLKCQRELQQLWDEAQPSVLALNNGCSHWNQSFQPVYKALERFDDSLPARRPKSAMEAFGLHDGDGNLIYVT